VIAAAAVTQVRKVLTSDGVGATAVVVKKVVSA
jgi:hypothetical protein